MALPKERIQQLIGIAKTKNLLAAALIALSCVGMGVLALVHSTTIGGTVFAYLFFVVGAISFPAILYLDGQALRVLCRRLDAEPDQVAWVHVSPIANRLRRRESTVIVFFLDRTFVRFALPKALAEELVGLLGEVCPQARQTRELPLPGLLELEKAWRRDPEGFRQAG